MEWKNEYSTGIEEIDDQHKQLLRIFSILQDVVKGNHGWSRIHYSMVEVINFARYHFQFEEAIMRLFGFPDIEKHRDDHQQIIVQAEMILSDSLEKHTRHDVAELLRDWLVTHIQKDDQAFARYILSGAQVIACNTLA